MKSEQMLTDLTECVAIFDKMCDAINKLNGTEQRIMRLALCAIAQHAATFCVSTYKLQRDGLEAAFELLKAELIDPDAESTSFQPEELN